MPKQTSKTTTRRVEDIVVSDDFKSIPSLFNNPRYADFTITGPNHQIFHVHRAIICQNSTVLDELCDGSPKSIGDSYYIDGVPADAIRKVLVYLYTGQLLIVPTDKIVSIAACSARLGVMPLFRICLDKMAKKEEMHEDLLKALLNVTKALVLEGRDLLFARVLSNTVVGNAIADRFVNAILDDKDLPEVARHISMMSMGYHDGSQE